MVYPGPEYISGTHKSGAVPNGAERYKPTIEYFGGSNGLLPSGSSSEKVGGRSPPSFPMGFPVPGVHFHPPTSTNFGFHLLAPFGATSFYGYPKYTSIAAALART